MDARDKPVAVVVAVLVRGGSILLIRRGRGDYPGLWGLPGGKVERGEHLSTAAIREIAEETGVKAKFWRYCGLVSEHLVEDGVIAAHFLLHVCELLAGSAELKPGAEGALEWFSLERLEEMRGEIIPSDFLIIKEMVKKEGRNYYDCVLRKTGDKYVLDKFD